MKADTALYLLQDGTYADPAACMRGKDGVLRHRNGIAVATRGDGEAMTMAHNTEDNGNDRAARVRGGQRTPQAGSDESSATTNVRIDAALTVDESADPQPAAKRPVSPRRAAKAKSAPYRDREMKRR